jgi:hypothetical protein
LISSAESLVLNANILVSDMFIVAEES